MAKFGLIFFPRNAEEVASSTRLMDELGYDLLGLVDSHALAMDVYVGLTLAAANSSRLLLGPCVANPVTRDLSVTAAAIASIDVISNGRAFLGISRGFSGTRAVGLAPTTTSAMADAVPKLRALMGGRGPAVAKDSRRLGWIRRSVPIMMAASGPKGLRIAGRVADAVLAHMGVTPDIVNEAIARVHEGARDAGRDPAEIEVWVFGGAACADDGQAARNGVKGTVAGMGASVFSPSSEGKDLPRELEEPVQRLRREYRVTEHMQVGDEHNVQLIERLGLADYLVDRFAFAGTPADVRRKVEDLRAIGVDRFIFNVCTAPDLDKEIRSLAAALGLARPTHSTG